MSEQPPRLSPDGKFFWNGHEWKLIETPRPSWIAGAVMLAGGALVLGGAFLPWLSATAPFVGTVNRSLVDLGGDGPILLVCGAALAGLGVAMAVKGPLRWIGGLAILPLALATGILVLDGSEVNARVQNLTSGSGRFIASVGSGPYVSGLGIATGLAASLFALFRRSATPPSSP